MAEQPLVQELDDNDANDEYIPVYQAVKLISHNFDGNVKELRLFCDRIKSCFYTAAITLIKQP